MAQAQTALVTGGGTRIGRTISRALATAGFDVAVHCHHSLEGAEQVADWVREQGCRATVLRADLTRPGAARKIMGEALDYFGGLSLLVNNAAVFYDDTAGMLELAQMKILNVDVPVEFMTEARGLLEERAGSVVNIADAAYRVPLKGYKAYSRSQKTLADATVERAMEWASGGVRVNAVCPGTVLPPAGMDPDLLARIVQKIPMGRVGTPADVADAVVFLAGASFVTGQLLAVDGGRSLCVKEEAGEDHLEIEVVEFN